MASGSLREATSGSQARPASGTVHAGHFPLPIEEDASSLTSWFQVSLTFVGRLYDIIHLETHLMAGR